MTLRRPSSAQKPHRTLQEVKRNAFTHESGLTVHWSVYTGEKSNKCDDVEMLCVESPALFSIGEFTLRGNADSVMSMEVFRQWLDLGKYQ